MNDHSELWQRKKSLLSSKETAVKGELEEVSSDFEKKVKYVLIISLITGVVFVIFNNLFRKKRKGKKKESPGSKREERVVVKEKAVTPGFGIKTLLMEKLIVAIVGFVVSQLKEILAGTTSKEEGGAKDS